MSSVRSCSPHSGHRLSAAALRRRPARHRSGCPPRRRRRGASRASPQCRWARSQRRAASNPQIATRNGTRLCVGSGFDRPYMATLIARRAARAPPPPAPRAHAFLRRFAVRPRARRPAGLGFRVRNRGAARAAAARRTGTKIPREPRAALAHWRVSHEMEANLQLMRARCPFAAGEGCVGSFWRRKLLSL